LRESWKTADKRLSPANGTSFAKRLRSSDGNGRLYFQMGPKAVEAWKSGCLFRQRSAAREQPHRQLKAMSVPLRMLRAGITRQNAVGNALPSPFRSLHILRGSRLAGLAASPSFHRCARLRPFTLSCTNRRKFLTNTKPCSSVRSISQVQLSCKPRLGDFYHPSFNGIRPSRS
jgi:hypothetical protein